MTSKFTVQLPDFDDGWSSEGAGPESTFDNLVDAVDNAHRMVELGQWTDWRVINDAGTVVAEHEKPRRSFTYEPIDRDQLTATDLRQEWDESGNAWTGAYRIRIDGAAEAAEALVIPFGEDAWSGRIGIAWGAPADWGDVSHLVATAMEGELPEHVCDGIHDIEQAIGDWLDDDGHDAWEARR